MSAARQVLARGGHKFGLEQVAREAGLTRRTIYHHFDSRLALLDAVLVDFEIRAGVHQGLRAFEIEHPGDRFEAIARETSRIWAAEHEMIRAVFGLAFDPAVRQMIDAHDSGRRQAFSYQIIELEGSGRLHHDLTAEQALAGLMLLTGFEAYDHLVSQSGLSTEAASRVLGRLARSLVMPDR